MCPKDTHTHTSSNAAAAVSTVKAIRPRTLLDFVSETLTPFLAKSGQVDAMTFKRGREGIWH